MSTKSDVVVIGAGPAGCVAALAFARQGAKVTLLEANPQAARRLAGEWMHPPGAEILERLGLRAGKELPTATLSKGFVVHPDDPEGPIVLPYANRTVGLSGEHWELVEGLRKVVREEPGIEYLPQAKATRLASGEVTFEVKGRSGAQTLRVERIVGAEGRRSIVRRMLGLPTDHVVISNMAGLLLEDVELSHEGYGHLIVGGPGPILAYRVAPNRVRMIIDVPQGLLPRDNKAGFLWDTYSPVVPVGLRAAFRRSLEAQPIAWCANQVRIREDYGRHDAALIGDAVGHYHPLTAIGMTMGAKDAVSLATRPFAQHVRERREESRTPGLLAVTLYDIFAHTGDDVHGLRQSVYRTWRTDERERVRTMQYLATQDTSPGHFWRSFFQVVAKATWSQARHALAARDVGHLGRYLNTFEERGDFLVRSIAKGRPSAERTIVNSSRNGAAPVEKPARAVQVDGHTAKALQRGVEALLGAQTPRGAWEGETVWWPMLSAQLVLAHHIMGRTLPAARQKAALLNFAQTQLPSGTWGQVGTERENLFVTTLVYVAARILGCEPHDRLLVRAKAFIEREGGVASIPSWGKFWLALLGLYDWKGVNPVLPEVWLLPRELPIHPSRYYCHTRLIYMGMAYLYGNRPEVTVTPLIEDLRRELYPNGYERTNFRKARSSLREKDLFQPPSRTLGLLYGASRLVERVHGKSMRARALQEILEHIRYEFRTTSYTCISPVTGLLNILSLWRNDPTDPDINQALDAFEGWIWEDDEKGLRVAGARSATWDTSWALLALHAAAPFTDCLEARRDAEAFLAAQQIQVSFHGYAAHDRIDPKGGFPFAEAWHGWPVSDCTAEALCALFRSPGPEVLTAQAVRDAVDFILRCQNDDGGFGSYEARRSGSLEWMNPAEMFGDSMTEGSYVECTASCVSALAEFRQHYPRWSDPDVDLAIAKAEQQLRRTQRPDGAWPGFWGVNFIYGTWFGVRGLLAAGATTSDAAVRRACDWLVARQRPDGGFGERVEGCWTGEYVPHEQSQVLQTAWALLTLIEAKDPRFDVIAAAADFLAKAQGADGQWPTQDPGGVFFRTALLDYTLYKSFFPVWALGEFESLRLSRLDSQGRLGDAAPSDAERVQEITLVS